MRMADYYCRLLDVKTTSINARNEAHPVGPKAANHGDSRLARCVYRERRSRCVLARAQRSAHAFGRWGEAPRPEIGCADARKRVELQVSRAIGRLPASPRLPPPSRAPPPSSQRSPAPRCAAFSPSRGCRTRRRSWNAAGACSTHARGRRRRRDSPARGLQAVSPSRAQLPGPVLPCCAGVARVS